MEHTVVQFQKWDTLNSYHGFRDEAMKSLCNISCMCTVVVTVVGVVGRFDQGCVCTEIGGRSIKFLAVFCWSERRITTQIVT